jgi:pilus assembly protein CpaB
MRFKDIIGLGIALVLAIGVAFLTRFFLTKKEEPKQELIAQQQQVAQILIAGKALPEGDKIKSGDLVWQKWPLETVNSNYITPQVLASLSMTLESLTGSVVRDPFLQGEPILIKGLIKQGERSILSAIVAPGKRAISIDVTPTTASSGLVTPGDMVDIVLSYSSATTPEGEPKTARSKTILEGIKVLAIDANLTSPEGKISSSPRVATLEVTPEQAQILVGSVKEGILSLSLRSLEKSNGAFSTPDNAVPTFNTPDISAESKVTIIRGKDVSTIEFKENQ